MPVQTAAPEQTWQQPSLQQIHSGQQMQPLLQDTAGYPQSATSQAHAQDSVPAGFSFGKNPIAFPDDVEPLPDVPEEALHSSWNGIVKKWKRFFSNFDETKRISKVYNRRIFSLSTKTLLAQFREIHDLQQEAYKVQMEVGYTLRDLIDGSLEYYFASTNTSLFPKAMPVLDDRTLRKAKQAIKRAEIEEKCLRKRNGSRYTFFAPINLIVYVYSLGGPIRGSGDEWDYLRSNNNIVTFANKVDSLCFFHSLAGYLRMENGRSDFRNTSSEAKQLCSEFCFQTGADRNEFDGINMRMLETCEKVFRVGIHVLGMEFLGTKRKQRFFTIRAATAHKQRKMYLLLHNDHFVLIKNVQRLGGIYECSGCYHVYNRIDNFKRHQPTCSDTKQIVYKTGIFQPKESIILQLKQIGVQIDDDLDFHDNSVIVYDVEVELKQLPTFESNTDNLQFSEEHVTLSIAVASNVPGFQQPKCFFFPSDCKKLVEKFIGYALQISYQAQETFRHRISYVSEEIETLLASAQLEKNKQLSRRIQNVESKFEAFVSRTPCVGYNCARYDLRALKHFFFSVLNRMDNINFCVKKDGAYLSVLSENLRFIDIAKFLGPGAGGLATYLKSYGKGECGEKMVFPYKVLANPTDLVNQSELPKYSDFYSELAGGNLFEVIQNGDIAERKSAGRKEYKKLKKQWKSGKWVSMLEHLKAYNCNDCQPLVKAIENHQMFYFGMNILMLREFTTLPSLCMPYLFTFTQPEDQFVLLDGDTHEMFRKFLFGGLAVITTRYAEVGKSRIKEHVYGNDGELCQQIQCLDANLLYTGCLGQDMFVGPYVIRCVEDGIKPRIANKSSFTIQFLEYLSRKNQETILHALSHGGERSTFIDGHLAYADEFIEPNEKRSAALWIEVNTCPTHGCPLCYPDREAVSTLLNKTFQQVYDESANRVQKIRRKYQVKIYWECELKAYYRENAEFRYFCNHLSFSGPRISRKRMTEEDILDEISSGALFGAVLCSVAVPRHKRAEFDQFPPVICRKMVSTENCGETMKRVAEQAGVGKIEREQLVGCFETNNTLFSTSMLQWYLEHNIRVYNITKIVQFTRRQPFKDFTEKIASMRKQADAEDNVLLSTTAKALGNSSYGFTLYSATRGNDTKFVKRSSAMNMIRSDRFISLEELEEDMVEVNSEKSKVMEYLPLHIGFQVYALSKVHMQRFIHDVLRANLADQKWEILGSDTDSVLIALSERSIDDCVKRGSQRRWLRAKKKNFVDNSCPEAFSETSRTPLLFKEEIESADIFLAPSAKCYFAGKRTDDGHHETVKTSAKGVNKRQNVLTEEMYHDSVFGVLGENGQRSFIFHDVENLGFRMVGSTMFSYSQTKRGFSPIYLKREVLPNLYSTKTLENFS